MSVGDFIGKLIINLMIIQIPMEDTVGKYKDCGLFDYYCSSPRSS
jgi:hypothetical protein